MDIKNPFLRQWQAILKDNTLKFRVLAHYEENDPAFLTDLNTKDVVQFWYIDALGNKIFGVDVEKKLFVINGCLVEIPLPEGEYELIAFLRTPDTGRPPFIREYAFGLQTRLNTSNINGKNFKRIFIIHPDGTVSLEEN